MGKEAEVSHAGIVIGEGSEEGRVLDWEDGLPSGDDLIPLSLHLVPPDLASAFGIPPADLKTMLDVHRASQHTISSIITVRNKPSSSPHLNGSLKPFASGDEENCPMVMEDEDPEESPLSETSGGRMPELGGEEAVDSYALLHHGENSVDDQRALKRPRLVWTPQLHKRFVDVVTHLGIKNSVPKTIMQLMNVDGLTRENVASHLQKYRLYLKRKQGFCGEGISSSDHVFASATVQQNLQEEEQQPPPPNRMPAMIPMPIYAIQHHQSHGVVPLNNHQGGAPYQGFDAHNPYGANNWSGDSNFGSIVSYRRVSHNDK